MAVINTGSIVNDIRGSVGTETYARNQGGIYVRARTTPADPNTAAQQACRAAVTALSQYWSATLTDQQRNDWRRYAHQHPQPDRFGNPHLTNGYTRFIQVNANRYRLDTAVAFSFPPTAPALHPPVFTFTASSGTEEVIIALPPTNYDPPFNGLELFAFIGPEVNAGVNFYNGPWVYLARNWYNGAWDDDPWELDVGAIHTEDQKVFMKLIAQHKTSGELSTPYQTSAIVT